MTLKAIWLLDICTGLGVEITQSAWEGQAENVSNYSWPTFMPISSTNWQFWQLKLQQCLGLDRWKKLHKPLGHWFPGS